MSICKNTVCLFGLTLMINFRAEIIASVISVEALFTCSNLICFFLQVCTFCNCFSS